MSQKQLVTTSFIDFGIVKLTNVTALCCPTGTGYNSFDNPNQTVHFSMNDSHVDHLLYGSYILPSTVPPNLVATRIELLHAVCLFVLSSARFCGTPSILATDA